MRKQISYSKECAYFKCPSVLDACCERRDRTRIDMPEIVVTLKDNSTSGHEAPLPVSARM